MATAADTTKLVRMRRTAAFRHRLLSERLEDRRLLAAGDLDTTFGNDGLVNTALDEFRATARSVVVQPRKNGVMPQGFENRRAGDPETIAAVIASAPKKPVDHQPENECSTGIRN